MMTTKFLISYQSQTYHRSVHIDKHNEKPWHDIVKAIPGPCNYLAVCNGIGEFVSERLVRWAEFQMSLEEYQKKIDPLASLETLPTRGDKLLIIYSCTPIEDRFFVSTLETLLA